VEEEGEDEERETEREREMPGVVREGERDRGVMIGQTGGGAVID
jgi:hypothetical protein